jgi:predicted MPP superfamily phosphohydrolase
MRPFAFLGFLAVVLGLLAGLHLYVWARLIRDPGWGPGVTRWLTVALLLLALGIPASFFLGRVLPPDGGRPLLLLLNGWLGVLLWLVLGLAVTDLLVLGGTSLARLGGAPVDPDRRQLLARLIAGSLTTLVGGATVASVHTALGPVTVREVRVALRRLPTRLSGYTLVQISDLHVGPTLRRDFVERVVAQVNAVGGDAVVITGDLVDGSVEHLRELVAPLAHLRARQGVYFVTGNHEYYSGAEAWCRELERLGIRVLRNERVPLGDGADTFDLAGVYDWDAARHTDAGHRMELAVALAGRDPTREVVLLAHQPRAVHEATRLGVGLVLSGHTHGGQFWPWNYFVRLQQPVVRGLWQFDEAGTALHLDEAAARGPVASTRMYVHPGTGYWGPPLRLGAPAEIAVIRLLAPAA